MADYKTMYYTLAAKVADAIEILEQAQRQCEEIYLDDTSAPLELFPEDEGGKE